MVRSQKRDDHKLQEFKSLHQELAAIKHEKLLIKDEIAKLEARLKP